MFIGVTELCVSILIYVKFLDWSASNGVGKMCCSTCVF